MYPEHLSNLERLEGPWLELIATGDAECVATALRLFHSHLRMTITKMAPAMVISEAQQNLRNAADGPQALPFPKDRPLLKGAGAV